MDCFFPLLVSGAFSDIMKIMQQTTQPEEGG